jgi:uncharacterized damage-inducible protein DinB
MSELEQVISGDSAHTPPSHILEGVSDALAHRRIDGAPHTLYQELWHIAFWQQVSLEWIAGIETPFPARFDDGFPGELQTNEEPWAALCQRFFRDNQQAGAAARDAGNLDQPVQCPSRPGTPARTMTVREQLESLGAHNAYHFGRMVLLRQLMRAWPPASGGFSW